MFGDEKRLGESLAIPPMVVRSESVFDAVRGGDDPEGPGGKACLVN